MMVAGGIAAVEGLPAREQRCNHDQGDNLTATYLATVIFRATIGPNATALYHYDCAKQNLRLSLQSLCLPDTCNVIDSIGA